MDRAYVICHMAVSLDGKIDGDFHDLGISYLITEDEEHPVRESLEKLKRLYGVERLVLTGGASINGGFLKEDVIDEFSIVVLPYVDGDKQHKALADTDGAFFDRKARFFLQMSALSVLPQLLAYPSCRKRRRAASDLYGWRGLVSGRRERGYKPDTGNCHNDTGKCEALAWG